LTTLCSNRNAARVRVEKALSRSALSNKPAAAAAFDDNRQQRSPLRAPNRYEKMKRDKNEFL